MLDFKSTPMCIKTFPSGGSRGLTCYARLTLLMWALALVSNTWASNYYVDTSTQFNSGKDKNGSTFTTLRTGDRVYLKGGTNWGGIVQTLTGSMTDSNALTNPAIIYACDTNYVPSVGGVIINGSILLVPALFLPGSPSVPVAACCQPAMPPTTTIRVRRLG